MIDIKRIVTENDVFDWETEGKEFELYVCSNCGHISSVIHNCEDRWSNDNWIIKVKVLPYEKESSVKTDKRTYISHNFTWRPRRLSLIEYFKHKKKGSIKRAYMNMEAKTK